MEDDATEYTLYEVLERSGELIEVGMDEWALWRAGSSGGAKAIGTRGLNGCSCVVVFGLSTILLAHVSPLPGSYDQWIGPSGAGRDANIEGRRHHERLFGAVAAAIAANREHFPPAHTTVRGIFSVGVEGTMDSVIHQAYTSLADVGGNGLELDFYSEIDANFDTWVPPKGELVAFFRDGMPYLYLERRDLLSCSQSREEEVETISSPPSEASTMEYVSPHAFPVFLPEPPSHDTDVEHDMNWGNPLCFKDHAHDFGNWTKAHQPEDDLHHHSSFCMCRISDCCD